MTGQGYSCGACKFLRRRCTSECVFAPFFSYDEAATHFAAVHKVFGASNVAKLLLKLPGHNRSEAVRSISYEALARMGDPVYGCVAHIFALQEQIASLQGEIEMIGNQIANLSFGIPGLGISEIASHANSDIQFSSEEYSANPPCYHNELATLINQSGYTAGSHDFDTQMNIPPSTAWEDQNQILYPYPNPAERLLEGVSEDFFTYWLEMETAQTGIIPASGNIFASS